MALVFESTENNVSNRLMDPLFQVEMIFFSSSLMGTSFLMLIIFVVNP